FEIRDGRFVNEDGDRNACVEDVAFWLTEFLKTDLAAGTLANSRVDPQAHGTTGTGLDRLVETVVDDIGLNTETAQAQINAGARAADAMNHLIVDGIKATGIADDGDLTALDMRDLNEWVRANHLAEWTALHGDDENGAETGFHLVQNDGGTGYLYGEEAIDTIADGIYHLGFDIEWDRFVNEDGNGNASLNDVAGWLSLMLADDLAGGTLASGRAAVDPATLRSDIAWSLTRSVTVDHAVGAVEAGKPAALRLAEGTIALRFTADTPDDGSWQVLFSKDGASNAAGDISVFLNDGHLYVAMQDGTDTGWLKVEDHLIEAGQAYDLAVTFGPHGLEISLNGEKVAVDDDFTAGLAANNRSLVIGGGTWGRDAANPTAIWNHFDGTIEGFTVYDRALDRFEIAGLARSAPLADPQPGAAAIEGDLPAIHAGTGLRGEVFNRTGSFDGVTDLIAQTATQARANQTFDVARVDFGVTHGETTLGEFLGDAARLTSGSAATDMTTIGFRLSGYVWIPAGEHLITARSDDGFMLKLGGETVATHQWDRWYDATHQQITSTGGLYAIELFYYENNGEQGLRLEMDGAVIGPEHFFRSVADYQAALAAHGPMPDGGLPEVYAGPRGTTGTGLDQIIEMIGSDDGLAHRISSTDIAAGAHAADTINNLIVDAIRETGAANDGVITTAEAYDLSDYIRSHHYDEFVAAHGDDEGDSETGYHLVQNDGATTRLFAENAVNTVFDGLYHIGFDTVWGHFVNEDGNANVRVETVAYWLNQLLQQDLQNGTLANGDATPVVPTGPLGSSTNPDVVVDQAGNAVLAAGARNLTLTGEARNGTGNAATNRMTGNGHDNLLDGASGNDELDGGDGNDVLIGGRGADRMTGGRGDDTYWLDNAGDEVVELTGTGSGNDTVNITRGFASYTMGAGLEDLVSTQATAFGVVGNGRANRIETGRGADSLNGGAGGDSLFSGAGNDRLEGEAGNDSLDGGTGADTMLGGIGNDTYIVDNAGDVVSEAADAGTDQVHASISYRLGANTEWLVLTGDADLNATGNALANRITGNGGDNCLNGGGGTDRLIGGGGDDVYIVRNAGVGIVENAGEGIDMVKAYVDIALTANVENAYLCGTGDLSARGNVGANILRGNADANLLQGLAGSDTLQGGGGADTLEGGADADWLYGGQDNDLITGGTGIDRLYGNAGADRFIFLACADSSRADNAHDTIRDFSHAEGDRIDLSAIDAVSGGTDDAFTLVGRFTGAAGQLVVTTASNGYQVMGDVNGDARADFIIDVLSQSLLVQADFVL
ncbi:MAG: hypothetical protein JNM13_15360, partial [Hyphomicrobiaceae bacterium]|nr:hypothetical protein [Hyphomicrobiaceae bacterium]